MLVAVVRTVAFRVVVLTLVVMAVVFTRVETVLS